MTDRNFFIDSARECRRLARNAASDNVRWQLLLWAREFDAIGAEEQPFRQPRDRPSFRGGHRPRELEAAD